MIEARVIGVIERRSATREFSLVHHPWFETHGYHRLAAERRLRIANRSKSLR
jgi:hypothetical protein